MDVITQSILNTDEAQLTSLVETAEEWLVFIAPGLSAELAKTISERWETLGRERVKVILDVDPEVFRLGYGEIEALKTLRETAAKLGTVINSCRRRRHRKPGLGADVTADVHALG